MLESAEHKNPPPAKAENATVYFVLTDRFENGNPDNDHSYGRHSDGMQEIALSIAAIWPGWTGKLDYLQQLGVNALWISSPLEQIHGWVGGGTKGDFRIMPITLQHLDWTKLDANMGTGKHLQKLVSEAHKRVIRILLWSVSITLVTPRWRICKPIILAVISERQRHRKRSEKTGPTETRLRPELAQF